MRLYVAGRSSPSNGISSQIIKRIIKEKKNETTN